MKKVLTFSLFNFIACLGLFAQDCGITDPQLFYYDHSEIWLKFNYTNTGDQETHVEYGEEGFSLGSGTERRNIDTFLMIENLETFTSYDFYFQHVCIETMDTLRTGPWTFMTRRGVDGGILNVIPIASGCDLDPVEFDYTVINYGGRPLSLAPLFYAVNDRPVSIDMPIDGVYTGLLGPDSTDIYHFDDPYIFPEVGDYKITVWTEIENDEDLSNDTAFFYITNSPIISDYPYFESFETWSGGWYPSAVYHQDSYWNRTSAFENTRAIEGNSVWRFSREADIEENREYLFSPCFDFSGLSNDPIVRFQLSSDDFVEDTHIMTFEYSLDDGDNWQLLERSDAAQNWYSSEFDIVWRRPLETDEWVQAENILEGFAGEDNVRFRLNYIRKRFVTEFGFQMDAFEIFESPDVDMAAELVESTGLCSDGMPGFYIRVKNLGQTAVSDYQLTYTIGAAMSQMVTINELLEAGADTLIFIDATLVENEIEVSANVNLMSDQNSENDSINGAVVLYTLTETPYTNMFETLPDGGWDIDMAVNDFFDADQNRLLKRAIAAKDQWALTTGVFGPVLPETSLKLQLNWANSNDTQRTLMDNDSICIQISTDCFENFDVLRVLTNDNFNPQDDNVIVIDDLTAYEGENVIFRILFKNNAGFEITGSINEFSLITCSAGFTINIDQLIFTTTITSRDGGILLSGSNGNEPYTYEWNDGETGSTRMGLAARAYTVTATDAFGCADSAAIVVQQCRQDFKPVFEVKMDEEGIFYNGEIRLLDIDGNIEDYTLIWSNGYRDVDEITGLPNGVYSLTIIDEYGCQQLINFNLDLIDSNEDLFENLELIAFPNPVTDYFGIKGLQGFQGDFKVELLNLSGQKYFESHNVEDALSGNLGPVKRGINIVILTTDDRHRVFRLLGF